MKKYLNNILPGILLAAGFSFLYCTPKGEEQPAAKSSQIEQHQQEKTENAPRKAASIDDYITQNKERWLTEDLMPFLRLEECTSSKQDEKYENKVKCASYLEQLLLKKGFKPKVFLPGTSPLPELPPGYLAGSINEEERKKMEAERSIRNPIYTGLKDIRPAVYAERIIDPSLLTLLEDSHYDRRPVNDNPSDPWVTNPFEPVRKKVVEDWNNGKINDERIYARGAVDAAGHILSTIWALEAYEAVHGVLPLNVKLLFEGAEEIGSPGMDAFVEKYKDMLKADLVVINDIWTNRPGIPLITERLRGALNGKLCVQTAEKEGHSGAGSFLPNAEGVLSSVQGRIENPLTKEVSLESWNAMRQPTAEEIAYVDSLFPEWTEEERKEKYGALALVGNPSYSPAVRTILLPSWDWEQLPTEPSEGVIPSRACIAFKCRLVPGQDPKAIFGELEKKLRVMPEARYALLEAEYMGSYPAFTANLDNPYTALIQDALKKEFGADEIERDWNGAGEPIASYYQSKLGVPVFLTGYGHPNDNAHATNESVLVEYGLMLGVRGNICVMKRAAGRGEEYAKELAEKLAREAGLSFLRSDAIGGLGYVCGMTLPGDQSKESTIELPEYDENRAEEKIPFLRSGDKIDFLEPIPPKRAGKKRTLEGLP